MKTHVIHKLFGGPHHGKVVPLWADMATYCMPHAPKTRIAQSIITFDTYSVNFQVDAYTRRVLKAPGRTIYYWAYSKASREHALEMVMNYLLRGVKGCL
jgi:hypothetical protein